jgi:hypothetical protein
MEGTAGVYSAFVATPAPRSPLVDRTTTSTSGRSTWMAFLCLTLLGYALFGKGFAYLGFPPVFVGEAVLLCGAISFLIYGKWRGLFDVPAAWFLLLLVGWGIFRTVPDVSRYGANALRDAAVWGYSAFAIMVFGYILARPSRLALLLRWYDKFVPIFLVGSPISWLIYRIAGDSVAHWPWADVPIVLPKGGDALVHMSGILAFWVAGLGSAPGFFRLLLLAFSLVLLGSFDRSGFLSFSAAFTLCAFLKPHDRSVRRLVLLVACGLLVLAAANVRFRTWDREREVSFTQILENLKSVVGVSRAGDLDDTKQWRLEWWGDICNYTLRGNYFWTGKGFGINLADDDGYQVEDDGSLRNPHNGHLTMLARGGVPGLVLWLLVQLVWGWGVLKSFVQSRRAGEVRWSGLFLFLMAYWLAFMINTTFDVFIEGPVAGIWFWTIYGVGLAAVWLYRNNRSAFDGYDTCADATSVARHPGGSSRPQWARPNGPYRDAPRA